MKKALSLVLMIVLIVALAVPAASAADDTIKIGYIGDLSQSTALWGNAGKFGALEAIEEINAAGGVLDGKMLELVPMDGKGDSADSVNALTASSLRLAPTSPPATSPWHLLQMS